MPGREVAACVGSALVALLGGAASAAAGRVVLKTDAVARCKKDSIALHQPEGLKAVHWCNRDYGGKAVSLRGGHAELHEYAELGGPHDTRLATLQDVAYLDIDGDGAVEALVVLRRADWFVRDDGSSTSHEYSSIMIHRWKDGQAVGIGSVEASAAPVYAIAAWRGKLAVRSGKQPQAAAALERFQLTADGFRPR